jgi:hypothetical protein
VREAAPPDFSALAPVFARGFDARAGCASLVDADLPRAPVERLVALPPDSREISSAARCQCSSCFPCGRPSRSQISYARCSTRLLRSDLIRLSSLVQRPCSTSDCRSRSQNSKPSLRFRDVFLNDCARLRAPRAGP